VRNGALRAALFEARDDRIFTRLLTGAITVQVFADLLRAPRSATAPARAGAAHSTVG
jgi:hypothetical protein